MKHLKILFLMVFLVALQQNLFALDVEGLYKEAQEPWTQSQAVKLLPQLNEQALQEIGAKYGPAAAERLAEKKGQVSALFERFQKCELKPEDATSAKQYLAEEFKQQVLYYQEEGCAASGAGAKTSSANQRKAEQTLGLAENAVNGGSLATREGAGNFFDGSTDKPGVPAASQDARSNTAPGQTVEIAQPKDEILGFQVPLLKVDSELSKPAPKEMPNVEERGIFNRALKYCNDARLSNWAVVKSETASFWDKTCALGKSALGAIGGGALYVSNLPQVEKAGYRLMWDKEQNADWKTLAADAGRLLFHAFVTVMVFLPVPIVPAFKALAAGEGWAIAYMIGMLVGPVNSFFVNIFD